jgi:hypothetical protein
MSHDFKVICIFDLMAFLVPGAAMALTLTHSWKLGLTSPSYSHFKPPRWDSLLPKLTVKVQNIRNKDDKISRKPRKILVN